MTAPRADGPLMPADSPAPIIANGELSPTAAARIAESWTPNTRAAYRRDWAAFQEWCARENRSPLPASAATLATYIDALTHTVPPPAPATLDRMLGTIQSHHTALGLPLDTKPARMVLRAYRRERAQAGYEPRRAPALTVEQLRAMVEATSDDLAGMRDRTLCLLGFAMMARRSELAALDIADVHPVPEGLHVRVRTSKTDRESVGAVVAIPYGSLARTCPVRTTLAWIDALSERGITEGPLLRAVDRYGRPAGSPGAAIRGSGRMSGAGINHIIKTLARRAGIDAPITAPFSAGGCGYRCCSGPGSSRLYCPAGTLVAELLYCRHLYSSRLTRGMTIPCATLACEGLWDYLHATRSVASGEHVSAVVRPL